MERTLPQYSSFLRRKLAHLAVLAGVIIAGAMTGLAQEGPSLRISNVLEDTDTISSEELSGLKKGKTIAKHLEVKDKRELAVIGIFSIDSPVDDVLSGFDRAVSRQRRKSSKAFGKFSNPPRIEDLSKLTLQEGEIEDLRNCSVGKCRLRLSEDMIERFRKEIDWDAANYKAEANRLYRAMLLEYVKDYLARGNEALIEYRHKRDAVSLKDELQSLQRGLILINEFAPEFSRYLEEFPKAELSNVEDVIRWSVVKVALKPVVTITHISVYTKEENGISQRLAVSKQIYANHQFDGSVSLTAVASVPGEENASTTYFMHENHARVSALGGALGGLIRGIAEDRAIERLETVLKDTKRYTKFELTSQDEEQTRDRTGFLGNIWGSKLIVLIFAPVVVMTGVILMMARRGRR